MSRVAAFALGALFLRAPLVGIVLLAACAPTTRAPAPASPALVPASMPPLRAPARFFHALPEAGFWVTHDAALDRVLVEGARLELSPSGQVLRAAWNEDLVAPGDVILGSIAAPTGGGFVHWTRTHLFRSSAFTGPMEPFAMDRAALRGVRPGVSGLVAITEQDPRAILIEGSARLAPFAEPGVLDVIAASPTRAIQLDVFGRTTATFDGGRTWRSLTASVGTGARAISADDEELGVETWQGRFLVGPGGKLAPAEASRRGAGGATKPFQLAWRGTRSERDEASFGYREISPFQAAVLSGAAVGDGTAFGVAQNAVARIDLTTGKTVSFVADGVQSGLECQPLRSGDDVLFACAWDRYQGAGGYVLRSQGAASPVVERVFTDAGSFVADDDGALGYLGSCVATSQRFDPEEASRNERGADRSIKPVFCVRRAPDHPGAAAAWIERTVEIERPGSIAAWAPRRDGTAVALVMAGGALPDPVGERRAREQGGVRVIRVDRSFEGRGWTQPTWTTMGRALSSVVDKRFHARDDGSIDAWLAPPTSDGLLVWLSVTVAADGTMASHPSPPAASSMQVTGDFGAAISRRGDLFETLDHGLSWRAAGASPLPPSAVSSGGCSALGCVLGPLVRLGWGEAAGLAVSIASETSPSPPAAASLPRLACVPAGGPIPVVPPTPLPSASKQTIATTWGDALDLAPARTTGEKRTHTLLFRPPLAPFAVEKRLDVVAPGFTAGRVAIVTPLLGAAGEIDLLLAADAMELLIAGVSVTAAPAFEPRRYGGYSDGLGAGGLALGAGRSLLLGESRRRPTLEDHRASPPPPLFFGTDREPVRRRAMTLGRSFGGAAGVLVFDGAAPETVGVAPIDPAGAGLLALGRLAPWSTLTLADDPRCKAPDPTAYRALVVLDPSTWLALDPRSLPGVTLGQKALAEVRWGRSRVCLAALDAAVTDTRRRGDAARTMRLVVRWDGQGAGPGGADPAPNGALRAADLRQDLRCALAPIEASR